MVTVGRGANSAAAVRDLNERDTHRYTGWRTWYDYRTCQSLSVNY
jgi:hypothetical protein